MLIENTLFGVVNKVDDAIFLLKQNEPTEGYYLCFSGGKDSVVVYDLLKRAEVKFDTHYNFMTVEPPELLEFIVDNFDDVIFEYPNTTMFDLIVYHHIPPLRNARYCCQSLKLNNGKGRIKVTGVRRFESRYRSSRRELETNSITGDKLVNPIVNWTDTEIWEYIHKFKIPYCKLYDEGRQRIGCIFCPFANKAAIADDLKRYPQFVNYYVKALDIVIANKIKQGKKSVYASGAEWFNAWIDRTDKTKLRQYRVNNDELF